MKINFYTLILFLQMTLPHSLGFAEFHSPSPKLIPSTQPYLVAPSGDGTGNGAGPDIKKMIAMESRYASVLNQCVTSEICDLVEKEKALLTQYLQQIKKESLLEFVTSQSHPEFIVGENLETLYLTGTQTGTPNLINSRVLAITSDEEAFILLTSIYANHFDQDTQAGLENTLSKLVDWLGRLGQSSSMAFWSQYHIQFFSPSLEKNSVILTDGRFERMYRVSDFFPLQQDCETTLLPVNWVLLNHGHSIAAGHYTRQCKGQPLENGQIEYLVQFKKNVDWNAFDANNKKIILQIERVSWQKIVF